jgi:uncharacterized membrane protein
VQWLVFLWALVPFVELRGSIIFAVATGYKPMDAFIISVALNLLAIPISFALLDFIVPPLKRRFATIKRLYAWAVRRVEKHRNLGLVGLAIFVGVPLPGTGAYAGSLLAHIAGMERKSAAIAIAVGVVIAGALLWLLATLGVFFINGLTPT